MAVVGMIVTILPPVASKVAAVREVGMRLSFPEENGPAAVLAFVLSGIVGGGAAMLAAFLVLVFILVPWAALRQPADLATIALFDGRLFEAPQGKPVGRAFAVLIMGALAIPAFIIVGAKTMQAHDYGDTARNALLVFTEPAQYWGDMMWLLGIALIPVTVIATIAISVKMRQLGPYQIVILPPQQRK